MHGKIPFLLLRPVSFLDLTAPIRQIMASECSACSMVIAGRSQIFFNLVGDLLCYSGANEASRRAGRGTTGVDPVDLVAVISGELAVEHCPISLPGSCE